MRRSWAIACGLLATSRLALADAPALDWVGPECAGSRVTFESKLAELIAPGERAQLSGRVRIERRGGRLGITLSLAFAGAALGERRIDVKTCAAAADTAAVTASLAVFSATKEPVAAVPEAKVSREPPPVTNEAPPSAPRPARLAPAPELRAGLLGSLQSGALPAIAPGVAVELGLGLGGPVSAALLGSVSLAQEHEVDATGSVSLRLWSAQARACYAPRSAELLRLDTCAGVALLGARGQGRGFPISRDGSLLAFAPAVQLDLSLRAPAPLEWRLELEAAAPLSRQRFVVREREVARFAPITLSGRFGPLVRF